MKVFRRTCALALMVMMLFGFTATAFALPKGFKLSDSMPKTVECAVLTKTADFKATDGRTYILRRGATVTVTGIKKNTVSVVYKKVKGYMSVQDLVMTTCVKAYVSRDCYAYEYNGDKKARVTWGQIVYMCGRYTDKNGDTWILCTNKKGSVLAYIKKDNLYT